MTPEELREKVGEDLDIAYRAYWALPYRERNAVRWKQHMADAAICAVLEAAIMIPSNRANEATAIGDERTGAQMRIIMDEIYALLPQDKDTGSSAPVANRRNYHGKT